MKNQLKIFFLCFSLNAFAQSNVEDVKLLQLYLDKNLLEKVEDHYDENEESLSKNGMALERLAISFERRQKYKEAIEVYRKIITNFNKLSHEKIVSTSESQLSESVYNQSKLPFYYYKLAFLNTQLFSATHEYSPVGERGKYKKNAEGFIALSRKVKTDEADLKLLEDQLNEKVSRDESFIFKQAWYLSFDILSWQDRIVLTNKNSKVNTNLLSTSIGSCLGLGRKWDNVKYEFDVEGCFAVATATISSENRLVDYQQSSVAVKGVIFGPGMYYKALSENLLIGVHVPVKYTSGDWTNPNEALYEFDNKNSFEVGYFLQSKIKVKKVSIRTRLGKVFPNPGSLWSIGVIYDF